MNKYCIALILLLFPVMANALSEEVDVDGICYILDTSAKTAKVKGLSKSNNNVDIIVPESLALGGNMYKVLSIGDYAFYDQSQLLSLSIPKTVNKIGSHAFYGCSGLTSFIIPENIKAISSWAFTLCTSLTQIEIPDNVIEIREGAFSGCSGLTSIVIPNSVSSIGNAVFSDCCSLTSISLSDKISTIGDYTFSNCTSLASFVIPSTVTSIGNYAFARCEGISSIVIPHSVKSVGSLAFSGCVNLRDVYCYSGIVPSTGKDAFKDSNVEFATLHVYSTSIEAYKEADQWRNFGSIISFTSDEVSVKGIIDDKNKEQKLFFIDGRRVNKLGKGLFILYNNGIIKKVLNK